MKQIAPSDLTRKRYDRLAFIYDLFEYPMEWLRFASWRAGLMNKVKGRQVLEVGVGTGKNFPHYLRDIKVIAIDLSSRNTLDAIFLKENFDGCICKTTRYPV